jgi:plastocyanin
LEFYPDDTKCLNMPVLTYTVKFPAVGNFKFTCLVHKDMTGTVHVLSAATPLPYKRQYYVDAARDQTNDMLKDTDRDDHGKGDNPGDGGKYEVITWGEVRATGGGRQYMTIMRFLPSTIYVPVGATVEWTNVDPTEPHTVSFDENARTPIGPGNDPPAGQGATIPPDPDADLDIHAILPNPGGPILCGAAPVPPAVDGQALEASCFGSGNLGAANQDQNNLPQPNPSTTRASVTFTKAGVYNYYCAIHDELGMEGKVVVGDGDHDRDDK